MEMEDLDDYVSKILEDTLKDSHRFMKESLPKIKRDQQRVGLKSEWARAERVSELWDVVKQNQPLQKEIQWANMSQAR